MTNNKLENLMSTELEVSNSVMGIKLPFLLTEMDNILRKHYPGSTVILFGSYARGDAHEESDLDICVLVPELTARRIDMNVKIRGLIRKALHAVLGTNFAFDTKLYTYDEFYEGVKYKSTFKYVIQEEGVAFNEQFNRCHKLN